MGVFTMVYVVAEKKIENFWSNLYTLFAGLKEN